MTETPLSERVLARVIGAMGGAQREGQVEMVREIDATLADRSHLLVQAGTGTGKSIGYLVPLLSNCAETGTRALVSTATLALQRQILAKDAPAVVDAVAAETGNRPRVAVLKGWSNYLCLHRARGGYPGEGTLFDIDDEPSAKGEKITEVGAQIVRARAWGETTDTGDRDDLVPGVSDRAWRQLSVSKRECLGKTCPLVDECFAQRARDEANEADLVVTNHSLFGINATSSNDVLPEVDAIVIDEAHELAPRVRDQAVGAISQAIIARVARRLRTTLKLGVDDLETAGAEFGAALAPLEDGLVRDRPDALGDAMAALDAAARRSASGIAESTGDQAAKALARGALDDVLGVLEAWSEEPAQMITWVTRPQDSPHPMLSIGPLDVAPSIGLSGFGERPVVLTSATLALGGSFEAMARDCGFMVSPTPWRGIDVGSPFDPGKQAIMYIARHLDDPGMTWPEGEPIDELVELAQASGGGMLALFSSWRAAEAGAKALRERTGLEILLQGDETLSALVDRFRDEPDSCLVGTLSLWQGVDVAGPSLRLVVIDRIPFPHPDDPVAKARSLDATRRGYSGFQAVSLTHAALLMAQGAGRLLRSNEDRGVVAILDRRLLTKSYGAYIRASMPKMWPTTDPQIVRGALARLSKTE